MEFYELITKLTQSVCQGNSRAVADCFCDDGIYDDVFYGEFRGRKNIEDLIDNYFYRDATDFRWDIHDPVSNGVTGYCRYIFSYKSKIKGYPETRTFFEGVAIATLNKGLISVYREVANTLPALERLGFSETHLSKLAAKQGREIEMRSETKGHIN